ncbi:MAG: hypothetical protein EA395_00185 [Phormidium sp. GEM2.Bin31]|nr:hypothetical protein [Phormidium sp. BM_Day4_Bin.17]TVR16660.1 MAG: hypothetical protein EA395_00185 [Phormidium sp. GEM2.Bin31]UCJ12693.1 MAG: hypothetical protein JWS08_02440 [Phormidium sp. PBR-2020]
MVRSEIFTRARQGNPEALAALMNHSLQAKQITVNVSVQGQSLVAITTGQTAPDQAFMVNFICRGLRKLEADSIRKVTIVGYLNGGTIPLWRETIQLDSQASREFLPLEPVPPLTPAPLPPSAPPSRPRLPTSLTPVSRRRRQPPTLVSRLRTLGGVLLFLLVGGVSIAVASLVKLLTALLAENSIYSINLLGDLFRGIEIIEVFNVLVFAILGLGLGVATAFIPRYLGIRLNALVIILLLPTLLSFGTMIRYDNWINEFAANESISITESRLKTDRYLYERIETTGIWGFYLHTARYPSLPLYVRQFEELDPLESEAMSRVQGSVGIDPDDLSTLFSICMWGIRGFYFLVSAITVIGHFGQGIELADRLSGRVQPPLEETLDDASPPHIRSPMSSR